MFWKPLAIYVAAAMLVFAGIGRLMDSVTAEKARPGPDMAAVCQSVADKLAAGGEASERVRAACSVFQTSTDWQPTVRHEEKPWWVH